jgi:hypothetical protein
MYSNYAVEVKYLHKYILACNLFVFPFFLLFYSCLSSSESG